MSKAEHPTENPTLRLCYVSGPWAYFTPHDPTEVCGDDWDDAPYEHNAEPPHSVPAIDRHTIRPLHELAALWQTLDGLRGLRLVSPTTGQRQGGGRE